MASTTTASSRYRTLISIAALFFLAAGAVSAMQDPVIGGFVAVAVVGGLIGAALMFAVRRGTHYATGPVHDSFERDRPGHDVIDMSRIRVAGLGGLGMIAIALAIALFIQRIGQTLGLGLVGGFFLSLALISYRRHHAGRWS